MLPYDGDARYFGKVMSENDALRYFEGLMERVNWRNDEAVIFGRHIVTKRKVAWYGDNDYAYTYSNTTKFAQTWTNELFQLKTLVEAYCGKIFNSCLLNLYHNGDEGMAWHSDDEKSLGQNTVIASLSLGAERKFSFRHKKTKETLSLLLENGSLLLMQGATQ